MVGCKLECDYKAIFDAVKAALPADYRIFRDDGVSTQAIKRLPTAIYNYMKKQLDKDVEGIKSIYSWLPRYANAPEWSISIGNERVMRAWLNPSNNGLNINMSQAFVVGRTHFTAAMILKMIADKPYLTQGLYHTPKWIEVDDPLHEKKPL